MSLNPEIQHNYVTPHPTNFSSPGNLQRFYGDRFKKSEIINTLQNIDSYTLHREYKEPRQRNPYYVRYYLEQIQADLIDVRSLSDKNDGVNWLLLAIDSFSKYLWIKPMKNKSGKDTRAAFIDLVERDLAGKRIESFFTDRGKEFVNRYVRNYLQSKKIRHDLAFSEIKCGVAERANRTIQDIMYRFMTEYQTSRYIDVLDDIVQSYLQRGHRSLEYMTPEKAALPENHPLVLEAHINKYRKIKRVVPRYQVGDKVRIKSLGRLQHAFQRGYHVRFTYEQFEIIRISTTMPKPFYYLKSLDTDEEIQGGFYQEMLQPIKGDVHKLSVLKSRRRLGRTQHYVSYLGFGPKHNQWIDEDQFTADYRAFQQRAPEQQQQQREQQNQENQEDRLQREALRDRRRRRQRI